MSFYEDLVMTCQMNDYRVNMFGNFTRSAIPLSRKEQAPYDEQIQAFAEEIRVADCIVVGGASGLSAAGGGDFYYKDTPSFRKYFGKFADKYGFKGAFSGMQYPFKTREEFWGYLATFLHTTQTAPLRSPYIDLDKILQSKDFHIITTNQDTQFTRLYPMKKISEIQGDHRFFQCSQCCHDGVWDAVAPVKEMIEAMGEGTSVPAELIPHCPKCGAEAFPWVRGYGNFLQGSQYDKQYLKISNYIACHKDEKILFIELGVGRLTPMFIQEPFWKLVEALPQTRYISVNAEYTYLSEAIENRGFVIKGDIARVLHDVRALLESRPVSGKKD
jgi:NAD-dependent SIR2 family protein deacetylase